MILFLGITIFQPDAGQGTAIAASLISMFAFKLRAAIKIRVSVIFISAISVFFVWRQPDPLLAVDEVERILHLIVGLGAWGSIAMIASIGLMVLTIAPSFRKSDIQAERWVTRLGLLVYFLVQILVTQFGNFPVPVMGAGISGVVGWYIIYGLNARLNQ